MRFVLALLAVLALLSSPITAAAAQASCGRDGPAAMAGMDMSAMPGMDHAGAQKPNGDPCCDHTDKHKMSKDCAQACATSCAVAVALPTASVSIRFIPIRVALAPARLATARPFEPAGPERPPKTMV